MQLRFCSESAFPTCMVNGLLQVVRWCAGVGQAEPAAAADDQPEPGGVLASAE